jgi:hypothetical protein
MCNKFNSNNNSQHPTTYHTSEEERIKMVLKLIQQISYYAYNLSTIHDTHNNNV